MLSVLRRTNLPLTLRHSILIFKKCTCLPHLKSSHLTIFVQAFQNMRLSFRYTPAYIISIYHLPYIARIAITMHLASLCLATLLAAASVTGNPTSLHRRELTPNQPSNLSCRSHQYCNEQVVRASCLYLSPFFLLCTWSISSFTHIIT